LDCYNIANHIYFHPWINHNLQTQNYSSAVKLLIATQIISYYLVAVWICILNNVLKIYFFIILNHFNKVILKIILKKLKNIYIYVLKWTTAWIWWWKIPTSTGWQTGSSPSTNWLFQHGNMVIGSCVIMRWLYFSRLSVWGTPWNRRGSYKK
jgi:hypothetical protein